MHTIVETPHYLKEAAKAGMSEDEQKAVVDFISQNPTAGDEIKGTGGCRKLRFAREGSGKSGGYRVITFYTGHDIPVFLLAAFGKNQKANITPAERNILKGVTKLIADTYGK